MQRVSSDESSISETDEIETKHSNDSEIAADPPVKPSAMIKARKGGRTVSQYDPEEM